MQDTAPRGALRHKYGKGNTDKEGRNATWKTSGWFDDWVVGKTIKGTVKEHKEFNGIKQTELTRCRVA